MLTDELEPVGTSSRNSFNNTENDGENEDIIGNKQD